MTLQVTQQVALQVVCRSLQVKECHKRRYMPDLPDGNDEVGCWGRPHPGPLPEGEGVCWLGVVGMVEGGGCLVWIPAFAGMTGES